MQDNSGLTQLQKFEVGDIVFDVVRSHELMIITKRQGQIYYCRPTKNSKYPEIAFMERDLKRQIVAIMSDK